jgi:hypothetical protein
MRKLLSYTLILMAISLGLILGILERSRTNNFPVIVVYLQTEDLSSNLAETNLNIHKNNSQEPTQIHLEYHNPLFSPGILTVSPQNQLFIQDSPTTFRLISPYTGKTLHSYDVSSFYGSVVVSSHPEYFNWSPNGSKLVISLSPPLAFNLHSNQVNSLPEDFIVWIDDEWLVTSGNQEISMMYWDGTSQTKVADGRFMGVSIDRQKFLATIDSQIYWYEIDDLQPHKPPLHSYFFSGDFSWITDICDIIVNVDNPSLIYNLPPNSTCTDVLFSSNSNYALVGEDSTELGYINLNLLDLKTGVYYHLSLLWDAQIQFRSYIFFSLDSQWLIVYDSDKDVINLVEIADLQNIIQLKNVSHYPSWQNNDLYWIDSTDAKLYRFNSQSHQKEQVSINVPDPIDYYSWMYHLKPHVYVSTPYNEQWLIDTRTLEAIHINSTSWVYDLTIPDFFYHLWILGGLAILFMAGGWIGIRTKDMAY